MDFTTVLRKKSMGNSLNLFSQKTFFLNCYFTQVLYWNILLLAAVWFKQLIKSSTMERHSDLLSSHFFFNDLNFVFCSGLSFSIFIDDLQMPDVKAVWWQIYHEHFRWRRFTTPLFNQSHLLSSQERLLLRTETGITLCHKLSRQRWKKKSLSLKKIWIAI